MKTRSINGSPRKARHAAGTEKIFKGDRMIQGCKEKDPRAGAEDISNRIMLFRK